MKRSLACLKAYSETRISGMRVRKLIERHEEGQALVEAALVLPLLLLAGTGILIFGIYMMQILSLTEGVGSAGRVLASNAGITLDPCSEAVTAFRNAAPLLKTSSLTYKITLNPGNGDVVYDNRINCSSSSATSGDAANLKSGGTATVKVTYTNCSLSFFGNKVLPNGCSISQQVTETVQ
jgi:Flp pilus assembly protein TadG